ncbi:hypothetical protein PENTCL1PPCAC_20128, partial [Pristionchus entomophagus]
VEEGTIGPAAMQLMAKTEFAKAAAIENQDKPGTANKSEKAKAKKEESGAKTDVITQKTQ